MSEAKIGGVEFAIWRGERPSIERPEVVAVRRPGIEGVGSNLLPKYGREQTVEVVKFAADADVSSAITAIRALESTLVKVEYHGIDFQVGLSTKHLVQSVEIVSEKRFAKLIGVNYAGTPYDYGTGYAITARITLVPVAA